MQAFNLQRFIIILPPAPPPSPRRVWRRLPRGNQFRICGAQLLLQPNVRALRNDCMWRCTPAAAAAATATSRFFAQGAGVFPGAPRLDADAAAAAADDDAAAAAAAADAAAAAAAVAAAVVLVAVTTPVASTTEAAAAVLAGVVTAPSLDASETSTAPYPTHQ